MVYIKNILYLYGQLKELNMNKEEIKNKISKHRGIETLNELFKTWDINPILTGGSIIDILDDRTPKDYDFISTLDMKDIINSLPEKVKFIRLTKTALTVKYRGIVIQFLRKQVGDFPFLNEASTYNLKTNELNIYERAYNEKILIPNPDVRTARSIFRKRVKHWKKKGYTIDSISMKSFYRNSIKESSISQLIKWIKGNKEAES